MKFLVVLPDHTYFLWQMLVQMNNLKKHGYDGDTIYVITFRNTRRSDTLNKIMKGHGSKFKFYGYKDTREDLTYPSSVRPHVLAKLFNDNPKFKDETFFYMDPDVIFRKKIRFNDLTKNDSWYLSDTKSYIGTPYIKSKSQELFENMCTIVGIDPQVVEGNDENAGGAQYLLKNTDADFWLKVEKDSTDLYKHMINTKTKYSPDAPIQAWTADMWALLWNAWLSGHDTKVIKRFDFSWATDPIGRWEKSSIYHNAGAVANDGGKYFAKTEHQTSPFNKDIVFSDQFCSSKYVEEIRETEKTFKNIIF